MDTTSGCIARSASTRREKQAQDCRRRHEHNPNRKVYVNHCDPKWYDLNEKHATCSAAPTIAVNSDRIAARIQAARAIGLKNFTYVALLGRISDWSGGKADNINYWNMGPPTPKVFQWLAQRPHALDAYEMMATAYCCGAAGFHPNMYNQHRGVSLVDKHGNGQYGIREGFRKAAHDIRRSHGWPAVTLGNHGSRFSLPHAAAHGIVFRDERLILLPRR